MMQVTRATPAGSSSETALNDIWQLDSPGDGSGLRYQQRFTLQLPTGGWAEELVVDKATSLRLQAHHLISDALGSAAVERAIVAQAGTTGLRITLPIPRIIHSIRFASAHSPAGKTTQLFRTDGDTVAEEPVASRVNPVTVKQSAKSSGGPGKIGINTTNDSAAPQIKSEAQLLAAGGTHPAPPAGELGVTDGRILVRLLGSTHETLNTSSITEVNLSTGPENLRVGIRLPALGSELFFLPVTINLEQNVNLGESLRNQLSAAVQRLIDELALNGADPSPRPTLPDPLELELVVESDAPCRFTFGQFKLRYRLARESFLNGAPKRVLRFTSDQPQQQRFGIALPASVNLIQASLAVAAGDGDSESESAPPPTNPLNALISAATSEGLRIDPTHHWLSPLTVSTPMLIEAIDLLVTALSPSSSLQLEVTRDRGGRPDGELLASAELELPASVRRIPSRFPLGTRLQLQPGGYWLRLQSRDGAAVWHLQASPGARALQADSSRATGGGIAGRMGIARWHAATGSATAAPPIPEIRLSGQTISALRGDNGWLYDLTPALGGLEGQNGLIMRDLEVSMAQRGPVTLYPPRIEFDL